MIRLRSSLLLLAIAALLLSGMPASAATGDSSLPWLDAGQCTNPDSTPAIGTPVESIDLAFPPPNDFILCTCKFCNDYPDVTCQISPSGYSILCADYSRLHHC